MLQGLKIASAGSRQALVQRSIYLNVASAKGDAVTAIETMHAARLREQAALCRRLAMTVMAVDTAERMRALAAEYEAEALDLERRRTTLRQPALPAAGK
jgi:hypothetical protein